MIQDCGRTKIWSRKHNFVLKGMWKDVIVQVQTEKVRIRYEEYFCISAKNIL